MVWDPSFSSTSMLEMSLISLGIYVGNASVALWSYDGTSIRPL